MKVEHIIFQLASDKINGTLIKPGAQFSFNDVVGERTAEGWL